MPYYNKCNLFCNNHSHIWLLGWSNSVTGTWSNRLKLSLVGRPLFHGRISNTIFSTGNNRVSDRHFPWGSVTYPATYKIQNLFKSLPVLRFDRDENPTWWINQEIVLNEYNRNCLKAFQLSLKKKKKRVHYVF